MRFSGTGAMSYLLKTHAASRAQVIAAIYETVIQPQLADSFFGAQPAPQKTGADAGGGGDLGVRGDVALTLRTDPDLQMHFARAAAILEQEWIKAGRPGPEALCTRGGGFWVMIAPGGGISRVSQQSAAALKASEPVLDDLNLLPEALDCLKAWAARLKEGGELGGAPVVLASADPGRRFLCRCVSEGGGAQARRWLIAEALDFHWDDRAGEMAAATFGLNKAEQGLVRGLMWGETLEGLAESTGVPRGQMTERMQQILAKAGAPGQAGFLRLLAYLIAQSQQDRLVQRGLELPPEAVLRAPGLPDMSYYRYGADSGQPVIYLHSMMDGLGGAGWLQPQFRQRGFRVYAPVRAGFGNSEPTASPQDAFDVFIDQLAELIRQEKLQRPILLGHRLGGAFAHAAARRLRHQLGGALIVGGVAPVDNLARRYPVPGRQRLFRLIARSAPFLLRPAVRWWIRPYLLRGEEAGMERGLIAGGGDAGVWERLNLAPLFSASRRMLVEAQDAGMLAEFYWMVRDWGRYIGGTSAPVIYLHGDEDPVTPVPFLQATMAGRRNVQIRVCKGTGALLLFARPELVFAALEELADR